MSEEKVLGSVRAEVLDTAKSHVMTDREATHGRPEQTFQRIADLWNAYLRPDEDEVHLDLDGSDVAMLMALLKIARQRGNQANLDSYVDLAGYAACAAELALEDR
jgi:hypothetical protein